MKGWRKDNDLPLAVGSPPFIPWMQKLRRVVDRVIVLYVHNDLTIAIKAIKLRGENMSHLNSGTLVQQDSDVLTTPELAYLLDWVD